MLQVLLAFVWDLLILHGRATAISLIGAGLVIGGVLAVSCPSELTRAWSRAAGNWTVVCGRDAAGVVREAVDMAPDQEQPGALSFEVADCLHERAASRHGMNKTVLQ